MTLFTLIFGKKQGGRCHGQNGGHDPFESSPKRPAGTRAFVVAQLGQSLDGRIATVTGESRYINGRAALDHLHRIRAHVDAVVVGVGTVLADDPRSPSAAGRPNPARVVIDPAGRLPAGAAAWGRDGARRSLVVRTPARARRRLAPRRSSFRGRTRSRPGLESWMRCSASGLRRILIEGGATTISTSSTPAASTGCMSSSRR